MRQKMVVLTEHTCLDQEQIENYLLRRLPEPEIAVVEGKLLVCEHCLEIYSEVERYVFAMRVMSMVRNEPTELFVRHKAAVS